MRSSVICLFLCYHLCAMSQTAVKKVIVDTQKTPLVGAVVAWMLMENFCVVPLQIRQVNFLSQLIFQQKNGCRFHIWDMKPKISEAFRHSLIPS